MRTPSKEFLEKLNQSEAYQFIVNHPKPDFTELDKDNEKFEKEMLEAQSEDRKKMLEALHR